MTHNNTLIDSKLRTLESQIHTYSKLLFTSESDEQTLRILFRYLVKSYIQRIPYYLYQLRLNYELIHHVIRDTTLGLDSPLHQMWLDLKNAIYVNPQKKVQGNLEYVPESPELVMKTLYIMMKDRA